MKRFWARIALYASLSLCLLETAARADIRCPEGAQLVGDTPPRAHSMGCVKKLKNGSSVRHGVWIDFYLNGQKSAEGEYVNDRRSGTWQWWYPNGIQSQAGEYAEGIPIGAWTYWRANGSVDEEKMRAETGSIANFSAGLRKKINKSVR